MRWAYGITTVPERLTSTLPRTVESLRAAGFVAPTLFVDGVSHRQVVSEWMPAFPSLEIVSRWPRIGAWGNWFLGIAELWVRNPVCERYVMFQDDLVCSRNLRRYLELTWPEGPGYLNLYTFPHNFARAPISGADGQRMRGWYHACQYGKGGVALAFDRAAVIQLLSSRSVVEKPAATRPDMAVSLIDGGVVNALSDAHGGPKGWREWVHNPSLVQHVGSISTLPGHSGQSQADSFCGEEFDLLGLVEPRR